MCAPPKAYKRGFSPFLGVLATLGWGTSCATTLFVWHLPSGHLDLDQLHLCQVIWFTKLGHQPSDLLTAMW